MVTPKKLTERQIDKTEKAIRRAYKPAAPTPTMTPAMAQAHLEQAVYQLLACIGEDASREGLRETPKRAAKAWLEQWGAGYKQDPLKALKSFEDGAQSYDEMVLVKDIHVYSHCEHHLAPFHGVAHIAYIPKNRIVGLSKLVRVAEIYASRLQVQERLTTQIADTLVEGLEPVGVGVIMKCSHMCMCSRGVKQSDAQTVTSALRGAFLNPEVRSEFLRLVEL